MSATTQERKEVYDALAAHGAPLPDRSPSRRMTLENALAAALALAHDDPTLLRILPLVLVKSQGTLRFEELLSKATATGHDAELGLVLEVAANATRDALLTRWSKLVPTPTPNQLQPFFPFRNKYDEQLAHARTPALAKKWGFLMNVTEESFRTLLAKYGVPLQPR